MTKEEYLEIKSSIYEYARRIREDGDYADPDDAADSFIEYALDNLEDEYGDDMNI